MKQVSEFVITNYLDAALKLHALELDEQRKQDVAKQLQLLWEMAQLLETIPIAVDVDPANVFRP